MRRELTRRQRYDSKLKTAKKYPISLCAINFRVDDNLGYLIRSAACFGAERLYVVGHVPERSCIKASSGSLIDYVEIVSFATHKTSWTTRKVKEFKSSLLNWWAKQDLLLLTLSILLATFVWWWVMNNQEFPLK